MKKRAILILGLAMLIAAAGVVYAHWQETLTVDVSVATGDINPVWSMDGTNDDGVDQAWDTEPAVAIEYNAPNNSTSADPNAAYPVTTRYTKNVAGCTLAGGGTDTLTVTISNAYPSYWCTVKADLENIGTVPVKLQSMANTKPAVITALFDGATFMDFGYQLDPGAHIDFYISFHVENAALENTTYTFNYTFGWVNWNEYAACNFTFTPGTAPAYAGLYGGMVTAGTWADPLCGSYPALKTDINVTSWGWPAGGWGGWSCVEAGYLHIAGGNLTGGPGFLVDVQGPAKPFVTVGGYTYPIYPHFTYTPPAEGWVARPLTAGATTLTNICIP